MAFALRCLCPAVAPLEAVAVAACHCPDLLLPRAPPETSLRGEGGWAEDGAARSSRWREDGGGGIRASTARAPHPSQIRPSSARWSSRSASSTSPSSRREACTIPARGCVEAGGERERKRRGERKGGGRRPRDEGGSAGHCAGSAVPRAHWPPHEGGRPTRRGRREGTGAAGLHARSCCCHRRGRPVRASTTGSGRALSRRARVRRRREEALAECKEGGGRREGLPGWTGKAKAMAARGWRKKGKEKKEGEKISNSV
ncbi:hypothetical protein PVAP13_7NG138117 [Panicum virgatum]|uniref:Uncharacterized protein n=1 Tax=Panicum virgatum TaxID=38727 RepID=A0A8T0PVL5_PANVG|nr:hypothetical protein PVAP13_7NG138117 [Panicum virgatum]